MKTSTAKEAVFDGRQQAGNSCLRRRLQAHSHVGAPELCHFDVTARSLPPLCANRDQIGNSHVPDISHGNGWLSDARRRPKSNTCLHGLEKLVMRDVKSRILG